jgi:toxin ParE1/3/4
MAQKIKVVVAKAAREDLGGILDYLTAESPRAAAKIVSELEERLKRLPRFPKSGRVIPEIGDASLREVLAGPYRVMYRLEAKRAVVLRILHRKRFFSGDL